MKVIVLKIKEIITAVQQNMTYVIFN